MRWPKPRFPIGIIVFDELELIIFVSQGLTLSTANLVYFTVYCLPVLIVGCEAIDHDGYGQGEDEDTGEGAAAPNDLPQQGLRIEVITNCRQGHQSPPCDECQHCILKRNENLKMQFTKMTR